MTHAMTELYDRIMIWRCHKTTQYHMLHYILTAVHACLTHIQAMQHQVECLVTVAGSKTSYQLHDPVDQCCCMWLLSWISVLWAWAFSSTASRTPMSLTLEDSIQYEEAHVEALPIFYSSTLHFYHGTTCWAGRMFNINKKVCWWILVLYLLGYLNCFVKSNELIKVLKFYTMHPHSWYTHYTLYRPILAFGEQSRQTQLDWSWSYSTCSCTCAKLKFKALTALKKSQGRTT